MFLYFFGFLRSGELTAPEEGEFDPSQHLLFTDVAVDSPANPTTWLPPEPAEPGIHSESTIPSVDDDLNSILSFLSATPQLLSSKFAANEFSKDN